MTESNIVELHNIFLQNRGVSIDTRTLKEGDVFFALKGPNFDGNRYAQRALDSGAIVTVVDNDQLDGVLSEDPRYILVEDSLSALQSLASHHRDQSKANIIAITGSNGKTTTKELLAAVLEVQYDIIYTQGNLNNHIGVPLTLLSIREGTEIAIVEMGANHIGEIAELSALAKPNYGMITNIGRAHIEGFGSLEGVRKGKGELYQAIRQSGGHLFVNAEDPTLVHLADNYGKATYYSQKNSFNVTEIKAQEVEGSLQISFQWENQDYSELMNLYGDYNVPNILAALNIGYHFQISPPKALKALARYIPKNSRSQRLKTESNEVYLDAYNANPSSMEHALKAFAKVDAQKKVIILGDMFELGMESDDLHQSIANLANDLFDNIILVGKHFDRVLSDHMKYLTTDDLYAHLAEKPFGGATILLKGSRGMALEKLIEML